MQTRIAVIGIILENNLLSQAVNGVLHNYADIIVARQGIPYKERNIAVISVIVDGSMETINALTGKLGAINGVSVKTAISKA